MPEKSQFFSGAISLQITIHTHKGGFTLAEVEDRGFGFGKGCFGGSWAFILFLILILLFFGDN